MTDTLDRQLVARLVECCQAHPDSPMLVRSPDFPEIENTSNFERACRGEIVHVMVQRGPMLIATWVPRLSVQWLLDSYAH